MDRLTILSKFTVSIAEARRLNFNMKDMCDNQFKEFVKRLEEKHAKQKQNNGIQHNE